MKRFLHFCIGLIGISFCISSCSSNDEPQDTEDQNPRVDIILSRSEKVMVDNNLSFSVDLLQAIDSLREGNFMVSPLALANNLVFYANGASGETLEEILSAINPTGTSIEELTQLYRRLQSLLPSLDKQSEVGMYGCFARCKKLLSSLSPTFVDQVSDLNIETLPIYDSQTEMLDAVRKWSKEMVGIDPDYGDLYQESSLAAITLNAVSFRGTWRNAFYSESTYKSNFYGRNSTSRVEMMHRAFTTKAWAEDGISWVVLPYGNEAYSMVIAMPDEGADPKITLPLEWPNEQFSSKVDLSLPKFTLEDHMDVKEALKAIGITTAFQDNADFFDMYEWPDSMKEHKNITMKLGPILQDSKIEVEESGTVATTVSSASQFVQTANPTSLNEIVVDHPFYFFIREQSTGLILFMGKIENL
ncbi:MAG: hypothetical protein LIO90_08720 [Bacteroidales bacterium]|nr:hypothetical protein [Bacteroidales bacterium]